MTVQTGVNEEADVTDAETTALGSAEAEVPYGRKIGALDTKLLQFQTAEPELQRERKTVGKLDPNKMWSPQPASSTGAVLHQRPTEVGKLDIASVFSPGSTVAADEDGQPLAAANARPPVGKLDRSRFEPHTKPAAAPPSLRRRASPPGTGGATAAVVKSSPGTSAATVAMMPVVATDLDGGKRAVNQLEKLRALKAARRVSDPTPSNLTTIAKYAFEPLDGSVRDALLIVKCPAQDRPLVASFSELFQSNLQLNPQDTQIVLCTGAA